MRLGFTLACPNKNIIIMKCYRFLVFFYRFCWCQVFIYYSLIFSHRYRFYLFSFTPSSAHRHLISVIRPHNNVHITSHLDTHIFTLLIPLTQCKPVFIFFSIFSVPFVCLPRHLSLTLNLYTDPYVQHLTCQSMIINILIHNENMVLFFLYFCNLFWGLRLKTWWLKQQQFWCGSRIFYAVSKCQAH